MCKGMIYFQLSDLPLIHVQLSIYHYNVQLSIYHYILCFIPDS